MTTPPDGFRDPDGEARSLARRLLGEARLAAIGVLDPATGAPVVTRIAMATDASGCPLTLLSDLATHTAALRADPRASILVGDMGDKGDPLTWPRLTIAARASFIAGDDKAHADLRARYLSQQPKAALYIDFADFHLVRLTPESAMLNGGFGKAYRLAPDDLRSAGPPAP